jgi:hypothetical protein
MGGLLTFECNDTDNHTSTETHARFNDCVRDTNVRLDISKQKEEQISMRVWSP